MNKLQEVRIVHSTRRLPVMGLARPAPQSEAWQGEGAIGNIKS